MIKTPFLTQKVPQRIHDVVIGHTFIIALQEDGTLVSWGEDKLGCLGLGTDHTNSPEPRKIHFGPDLMGKIVDIQYGKHHILALTNYGKIYAWGDNADGQLGLNDMQTRYEPVFVEEMRAFPVIQVLAVDNMSYALTRNGVVYAWGENKEGSLALEHDNPRVTKPEIMMRMKETFVKKLQIKECGGSGRGKGTKTVIAFVELADPLTAKDQIGGFEHPLGETPTKGTEQVCSDVMELDMFDGVDLMRQVMDNTQDWWLRMLDVQHGAPYDDDPSKDKKRASATEAQQLDISVSLDSLERASYELDMLIQSAKSQLVEIRNMKGTKNVKFMLSMFMDDCKLRREKIRRTVAARQLIDLKAAVSHNNIVSVVGQSQDDVADLTQANSQLNRILQRVRNLKTYDVFTQALQNSLAESLECKLQVHETQIECIKAHKGRHAAAIIPALRTIKERWGDLKRFSIYNLFQECSLRGQNLSFSSDDEMLAFLVHSSDQKLDQIIHADKHKLVSRDRLVPSLVYDMLVENAELRKMCNTYQLKVLLMREGKEKPGGKVS